MGGHPVFAGSRLPIDTVVASLDRGCSLEQLVESWPFLTESHVEAAREYLRLNPIKRQVVTIRDIYPNARLLNSKILRSPTR